MFVCLGIFYQYINQTSTTSGQQTFSALQKSIKPKLNNIIKKCLNKQTKLLFDLNRVTQNLSYLQEAMLDYQTATQQLKDLDPENSIEKKLQKLRNILIESIQEWISDDVLVKLDHKYQQWQKAVSQTRLSQQSFPTYQEIEDKFIKLQKIMDVLKKLEYRHSGISFCFMTHDPQSSVSLTTFTLIDRTLYIHYDFLVLLAEQYEPDILLSVLDYFVQEFFYLTSNTEPYNQSIEREVLRSDAIFACNTSWETMPINLFLLATIYQKWLKKAKLYRLVTLEQVPFLARKQQLYQKLALYLNNSQLALNDPTKTPITPGTQPT